MEMIKQDVFYVGRCRCRRAKADWLASQAGYGMGEGCDVQAQRSVSQWHSREGAEGQQPISR